MIAYKNIYNYNVELTIKHKGHINGIPQEFLLKEIMNYELLTVCDLL